MLNEILTILISLPIFLGYNAGAQNMGDLQDRLKAAVKEICKDPDFKPDKDPNMEGVFCVACAKASQASGGALKNFVKVSKAVHDQIEARYFHYLKKNNMLNPGIATVESVQATIASKKSSIEDYENTAKIYQKRVDQAEAIASYVESPDLGKTPPSDEVKLYFEKVIGAKRDEIKFYKEQVALLTSENIFFKRYKEAIDEAEKNFAPYEQFEKVLKGGPVTSMDANVLSTIVAKVRESGAADKVNVASYRNEIQMQKKAIESLEVQLAELRAKEAKGHRRPSSNLAKDLRKAALQWTSGMREQPNFTSCGMSAAELFAVNLYSRHGYKVLNRGLREGGSKAEEQRAFKDILQSALNKINDYRGEVRRGITLDGDALQSFLDRHKVGEVVQYPSFSSTSMGSGFGGNVNFIIRSKHGRLIQPYSGHSSELEVLFPPTAKFKVLDVKKGDGISHNIVLDEVE